MKVCVRLFGELHKHLPVGQDEAQMSLPEGACLGDLCRCLGLLPGDVAVAVVDTIMADEQRLLVEGDLVELFGVVSGG